MVAELQAILDDIARRDPDFDATLQHTFSRVPYEISPDHPFVEMICRSVASVLDGAAEVSSHSGWMDTAILAAAGIPCAVIGPVGEGLHGDVEWVDVASVHQLVDIVAGIIQEFCG